MSSSVNNSDERKILPFLEKHKDYVSSQIGGVLDVPASTTKNEGLVNFKDETVSTLFSEWKESGDLSIAQELFSHALTMRDEKLIKTLKPYIAKGLGKNSIIQWLLHDRNSELSLMEEIDYNKRRLSIEDKDSITWTDQAINFLKLGDRDEVEKSIENAIDSNKDSAFVVRNASRIFNLLGDNGRSIKTLKDSTYYKYDPNILSAEIAFSQLEKRRTKGIEIGRKVLKDDKFTHHQYSELAGALATAEYLEGDYVSSEYLFDKSLLDPNINSLTQSFWYKKNPIKTSTFGRLSSNELMAQKSMKSNEFEKAKEFALNWIKDEPYSSRPYKKAAYVTGSILGNYNDAYNLVLSLESMEREIKGEIDQEQELGLINDKAYFLLKDNRIVEASSLLDPLEQLKSNNSAGLKKVDYVILATLGLLAYRTGDEESGRKLYRRTIEAFDKLRNKHNVQSAFLNFFEEEVRIALSTEHLEKLERELNTLVTSEAENDILYRKNKVMQLFNAKIRELK